MHTLLVTNLPQKGEFIAKGLEYEQLPTDVRVYPTENLAEKTLGYDAVFIYMKDLSNFEPIVDACFKYKNLPIIILAPEFDSMIVDFFRRDKRISNLFVRPFPFRLIATEMRFQIFLFKEKMNNSTIKIRDLELNRESRELKFKNEQIYLRCKEFALLEFMMLNTGKVLSRGTILENVWDRNANIMTNTVDVHINKLRKKIHKDNEHFIRTVPCSGYIFS